MPNRVSSCIIAQHRNMNQVSSNRQLPLENTFCSSEQFKRLINCQSFIFTQNKSCTFRKQNKHDKFDSFYFLLALKTFYHKNDSISIPTCR